MPTFASAIKTQKIPILGLTPEQASTAPTSPTAGQLWTNTTTNVVSQWDVAATAWVPWLRLGTTATTAAAGNDSRITGALQAANNLSDLANVTTARTNLGLGTAAVANKVAAGSTGVLDATDPTTTNTRTPTDGTVTGGTTGAGVKIAASTITLANLNASTVDQAAATGSLRTLSLTALTSALPGGTTLNALATANAATAAVTLSNQVITNLGQGTNPSDAARLSDVQASAAGIDAKPSVRVVSTANLAVASGLVNGAVVDGITLATGDRILLKNQTTASENGPYVVVSTGAASRATDTMTANSLWFIEQGTVNGDTGWWITNDGVITAGTTALVISQFSGPGTYTGGTGITVSGTVISISTGYVGQTSITTLGTITTGVWTGTAIAVANGGTGASTAAGARTNLNASQVGYAATLGAVTAGTAFVVTHNLGTADVIAMLRDASTNEYILADMINASINTVSFTSGLAYLANALRIVVIPVA